MANETTYSAEREAAILAYQRSYKRGCSRDVAISATRSPTEIAEANARHDRAAKRIFDDIMVDGGWSV